MSTFTQRGSLLNRYSGFSVAVSGDGNVMACMGSAATTVEIYDRSGSAWVQRGSALSTTSEGYGTSVALNSDGTVLIVGAPNYSTNRGRVYTYDWTGSAWSLRGTTLIASDGVSYDYFGVGVAISQDGLVLAVGAEGWESGSSPSNGPGCVYIFDKSGTAWVQRGSVLQAPTPTDGEYFGHAVALSTDGAALAVSAQYGGTGGAFDVFDYSGGTWTHRGSRVTPSDAAASDQFGAAIAMRPDGEVIIVGANLWEGGTSNQGGVYKFNRSGSAWTQDGAVLTSPGAGSNFQFGIGVAIDSSGTTVLVRQYNDTTNGGIYTYDVASPPNITGSVTYTPTVNGAIDHIPNINFSGAVTYSPVVSGVLDNPGFNFTGAVAYAMTAVGAATYYRWQELLADTATASDPVSAVATLYDAIRETLLCAADCDESAHLNLSLSEAQAAIDTLIGGKLFQDALTEVANGGVSTLVEIALRMVERAAASDTAQTAWHTAMTVAETATALDLLAAGWAFHAIETADANDAATGFVTMLATLLEQAIATDTPANSLTLTVTATETADGADAVATLAHLFESLDESAAAAVTIRLGDDVYTGWALNTEDGAVSEFQRYEFNSFCQLQGEYYAAGTDGIYRIGGASDAGEAIVGYLKTGLLDFGSSMQKRMDSAWLAIATDGTVRLKVVTTDGGEAAETWYQVASKDEGAVAENLRLKIGKGLKSRHWQFELVVEDASEFELEEMQFVPMILSRRT